MVGLESVEMRPEIGSHRSVEVLGLALRLVGARALLQWRGADSVVKVCQINRGSGAQKV
jgi:hypothetical protein